MTPRPSNTVGWVPTERQYHLLISLASGAAGLSWKRRMTKPLLRWGWVTAEDDGRYFQWVQITPAGLRALAEAVEKFGLPELGSKAVTERRVCSDCGSTRYRIETVEVERPEKVPHHLRAVRCALWTVATGDWR